MDEGRAKPHGNQPRSRRQLDIARISLVLCKYAERFEAAENATPAQTEPEVLAAWREQPRQPVDQAV